MIENIQTDVIVDGKTALKALSEGYDVFWKCVVWESEDSWQSLVTGLALTTSEILQNVHYSDTTFDTELEVVFKVSPKLKTLEVKIPEPFLPANGEFFYYLDSEEELGYGCKTYSENYPSFDKDRIQFGAWKTQNEVEKAVREFRKVTFGQLL